MTEVNEIFRKTDFGEGYSNIGFEIAKVRKFLNPS